MVDIQDSFGLVDLGEGTVPPAKPRNIGGTPRIRWADAGLTNREIGERLYLSAKTIETHLTHIFQKLDVRSRTQVAALLGSEGAAPAT